jgi:dihydrolipoamide dehydrogenase
MNAYDVVVLGAGPGGYVAAEEAAKYGNKVAIVESGHLGGTCLNTGCIPSKTLLRSAEVFALINNADRFGIEVGNVCVSFDKIMARKSKIIKTLQQGIKSLLVNANVDIYNGFGTVLSNQSILIENEKDSKVIYFKNLIIATGSKPFIPPIEGIDHVQFHTSDTIFSIEELPKSISIIGGGVIGVEFASIFSSFGVEVHLLEIADRIIANEDEEAANVLLNSLTKKKNVHIHTAVQIEKVADDFGCKIIHAKDKNGNSMQIVSSELLIASGRKPNMKGLEKLNLKMNGPFIQVNPYMETNIPNIYAIGDVIGGYQLAHVASAEGIVAAKNISGLEEKVDYRAVPRCIYTFPEIAIVGLGEKEAKDKGYDIKVEKINLATLGKAHVLGEREGFIKVISDIKYGEILGAVLVGPHVTEMISEVTAFITLEGTVQELYKMIHPHPTISEGISDVAKSITPITPKIK